MQVRWHFEMYTNSTLGTDIGIINCISRFHGRQKATSDKGSKRLNFFRSQVVLSLCIQLHFVKSKIRNNILWR